jgi:peptidoglycan/xylan/chitin deacetylase (PgdA/CDA1 family)
MSIHHRVLGGLYHPLRVAGAAGRWLGKASANQLRVLLYHDISPDEQTVLAAQLQWLPRSWTFVSASRFAAMVTGREPVRGRHLLVTFDDGFASNRVAAERVLNPMEIPALFFVVPEFVSLTDRRDARAFIARHIYPGAVAERLPEHWTNMDWTDLAALAEQGHTIGGHTGTHARLSQVNGAAELEREISASADTIADRLGVAVEHFAYPFGDIGSFSAAAAAVARRRYGFVHSGLRGNNARGVSPWAIRRESAAGVNPVSCGYEIFSDHLLGAFLEGGADYHYASARAQLDAWAMAAAPEGVI